MARRFRYPTWVFARIEMRGLAEERMKSSPKVRKAIKNKESFIRGTVTGYMAGYETGYLRHGIMCGKLKRISSRYPHTLAGDAKVLRAWCSGDKEELRGFRAIWFIKACKKRRLTKDYQKGFPFGYKRGYNDGREKAWMESRLP